MWVWADKFSDIRFSLNDAYMVSLMTSFMILFMAILGRNFLWFSLSLLGVIGSFWLIRTQRYVHKKHYFRGMIPHHSMAVLMSRRLLENDATLSPKEKEFVKQIIAIQEKEIQWMKLRA
jgi:predicted TPR repeat methyltransferase